MEFRPLKKEDIDCRIATINEKGLSLLLYKNARVDMRMLDEAVGPMNWKRSHQTIDGNLYCTIEIWDAEKQQWIGKQDVGTESYTEKEKGAASDSFKRAGFNWGIGRELYTAPFIWVSPSGANIKSNKDKDRFFCNDVFIVSDIAIENGVIEMLEITNEKKGCVVFKMEHDAPIDAVKFKVLKDKCKEKNVSATAILNGRKPSEIMTREWMEIMRKLDNEE